MVATLPRTSRKHGIERRKEFYSVGVIKRLRDANIIAFQNDPQLRQLDIRQGMNVPNSSSILVPQDNNISAVSGDVVTHRVNQVGVGVGFHDAALNLYRTQIDLYTGESLKVTIPAIAVHGDPNVASLNIMRWNYTGYGVMDIEEYATEKHVKQLLQQRPASTITFRYEPTGMTGAIENGQLVFRRTSNNQVALTIAKPYYVDNRDNLNFESYVNTSIVKTQVDPEQWEITYPSFGGEPRWIDPTIVFGEGAGQTGGDHKDTFINEANKDQALGGRTELTIRDNTGAGLWPLGRWSMVGHISVGASLSSSVMTVTLSSLSATANMNLAIHRMITQYGVTLTDEGIEEDPATGGQATWDNAKDTNNPATDTGWANGVGAGISANDYAASEDTVLLQTTDSPGDTYDFEIPIMSANWLSSDANNAGWIAIPSLVGGPGTSLYRIASQEHATVAWRPKFTNNYTVPLVGTGSIAVQVGITI